MRKLSVILLVLMSLYRLNSAQTNSKEESGELKEPEWIDNPEIQLRKCRIWKIKLKN